MLLHPEGSWQWWHHPKFLHSSFSSTRGQMKDSFYGLGEERVVCLQMLVLWRRVWFLLVIYSAGSWFREHRFLINQRWNGIESFSCFVSHVYLVCYFVCSLVKGLNWKFPSNPWSWLLEFSRVCILETIDHGAKYLNQTA